MSQGKFASLTDSLLARKGEARPWEDLGSTPLPWRDDSIPLPGFNPMAPLPLTPAPRTHTQQAAAPQAAAPQTAASAPAAPRPASAAPAPTPAPFAEVRPTAVRQAPMKSHAVEFSDMSAGTPHHADEASHHGDDHEKVKKCTIRMSLHDYERLGIIAVKQNVTRQHLLQDALEHFFDTVTEPYQKDCACLNAENCCQG